MQHGYIQCDLFSLSPDDPSLNEAKKAYKALPKKRIHNKIPTYTKTYTNYVDSEGNTFNDVITWGRMSEVYSRLANIFPLINTHSNRIDFGIVRSSREHYTQETYKYKGIFYKGQEFTERQAEIIGSELLGIEERLFLHSELLEALENGYQIEQCNEWVEGLLNLMLQGYSARIIILALVYCFPRGNP